MDQPDAAELELVAAVARGDEKAFLAIYDRYAGRVYSLTVHILEDPMLAEEVTQDTFTKFWGRAGLYRQDRGAFGVWLLTIARRTALDRLRLEGRRPTLSDGRDPDDIWHELPDKSRDPEEARWRALHFAVTALPEQQQRVIELAYYQGLSQSDIAAELGWPLGTVKTRMRAALQALRRVWLQEDAD